ncbi:hypothetical protein KMI_10g16080 [Encephalitozoon hellem]|nr:hypothetical protein KMI_10g16080 [Encephalitozoon hellem]
MNCQVCTGGMDLFARYDCGHRICMTCSARLVFLYMQCSCPLCRNPAKEIIFSALSTPSEGFPRQMWKGQRAPLAVFYEGEYVKKMMEDLLSNKCRECRRKFGTLKELKKHYAYHGFVLCSECIKSRRDFWHEIKLYKSDTIRSHRSGSLGEEGFDGHVFCVHCKIYLFDSDDARKHCNLKHELCNICDILGKKYQYYNSFKDLEAHYKNAHYCCGFQTCQMNKCYVFPYQTELFDHLNRFHKACVKLSEIPRAGRCSIPVMDPLRKKRTAARASFVDQSGGEIRLSSFPKANTSQGMASESAETELPKYLDRNILEEERKRQSRRKAIMERICKAEADGVEEIVNEFLEDIIDVMAAFNKISDVIGDKAALKLFETMNFGGKQGVVQGSMKALRKKVMFPKFVPSEPVEYKEPKEKKSPGFAIIDLCKKK